jgi:protocatechuate 3,4-dioxygenase beta subunit
MTRLRFPWLILTVVFLTCLSASVVLGQSTNTGTVVGNITDQNGAVVPGVTITLTDVTTSTTRTTITNDDGHYVFVNIPPASYEITASKTGRLQVEGRHSATNR